MNFADFLRNSATVPEVAFQRFLLAPKGPTALHLFYEGHDDPSFYIGFITPRAAALSVYQYACKNKAGVYDTARLIFQNGSVGLTLFFVDKDLSDVLGHAYPVYKQMFVTKYYSIENYLVCREILERVCIELIRVNRVSWDVNSALSHFDVELTRFYHSIKPIMAWIIFHRQNTNINLQGINLNNIFLFDDIGVCCVKRKSNIWTYLDRVCGVTTNNTDFKSITSIYRHLNNLEPKLFVRGKFEGWFFVEFIKRLVGHLHSYASTNGGSANIQTPLHEGNLVEVLAPRLSEPADVKAFLDSNI